MSLVDYSNGSSSSSSSDESETSNTANIEIITAQTSKPQEMEKNRKLLPSPLTLSDIFKSQPDKISSLNQHNGKIRSFPHERGIWATYVYIELNVNDSIIKLQNELFNILNDKSLIDLEMQRTDKFHISLTRVIILHHHWIPSFIESIKKIMTHFKRFSIDFNNVNVLTNDENTRTFIVMGVNEIWHTELKSLVNQLDNCLRDYNLPAYYKNPSFHTSILWCVGGDAKQKLIKHKHSMQTILDQLITDDNLDFQITINTIQCKIGNKFYNFNLN